MRALRLFVLAAVCLAVSGTASSADSPPGVSVPQFGAPSDVALLPETAYLQDVTVADVNGDGNPDLIATRIISSHPERTAFSILSGNGRGSFRDATTSIVQGAVPGLMWSRQTVVADFNGDGRPDIFFADTGFDQPPFSGTTQTLLLSTSDGKLVDASANLPQDATYTHTAAAADVNGDGSVDLYEGNICCGSAGPRILLNDGHGRFSVLPNALPADMLDPFGSVKYTRAAFADVNGDGHPDLLLLGEDSTPDAVLLNDGTGHFHRLANALPPKPFGGNAEGLAVQPVDLNGDGKLDLILAFTKSNPFYVGRWIQILINNGDGTFRDETATRLPQTDNSDGWPYAIQVADVNGDGKPDFAVTAFSQPGASGAIFLNNGDGTFTQMTTPVPAPQFVLADVNHDGRLDIVDATPSGVGEDYRVFLQLAPAAPKPPATKPATIPTKKKLPNLKPHKKGK